MPRRRTRRSGLGSARPTPDDRRTPPLQTPALQAVRSRSAVRSIPTQQALPRWLRWLILAQRSSLVVTFVVVVTTLFVYGSTVYTQQLWSKEYRKMTSLQRSERQMVAASEVMKGQIVQQADHSGAGMVRRTQEQAVFLQPAPERPTQPMDPLLSQPLAPTESSVPLSY